MKKVVLKSLSQWRKGLRSPIRKQSYEENVIDAPATIHVWSLVPEVEPVAEGVIELWSLLLSLSSADIPLFALD